MVKVGAGAGAENKYFRLRNTGVKQHVIFVKTAFDLAAYQTKCCYVITVRCFLCAVRLFCACVACFLLPVVFLCDICLCVMFVRVCVYESPPLLYVPSNNVITSSG